MIMNTRLTDSPSIALQSCITLGHYTPTQNFSTRTMTRHAFILHRQCDFLQQICCRIPKIVHNTHLSPIMTFFNIAWNWPGRSSFRESTSEFFGGGTIPQVPVQHHDRMFSVGRCYISSNPLPAHTPCRNNFLRITQSSLVDTVDQQ